MSDLEWAQNRLRDIEFIAKNVYPIENGSWEDIVELIGRIAVWEKTNV